MARFRPPSTSRCERFTYTRCVYCGYANGLIAYVREIAARTEQYWCPIKHARPIPAPHARYRVFFEYGDARAYRQELSGCTACFAPTSESTAGRNAAISHYSSRVIRCRQRALARACSPLE